MESFPLIDLTNFPLLEEFYLQINQALEYLHESRLRFDKTKLKLIEVTYYDNLVDWSSLVKTLMKIGCKEFRFNLSGINLDHILSDLT